MDRRVTGRLARLDDEHDAIDEIAQDRGMVTAEVGGESRMTRS